MNNILIPNTELSVSPFGLGTVDAGLLWDGADADRVFETYLELGGNLLDSAHVYSDWVPPEIARSERVIGDWLARSGKRDKIVLITKGGHPDMTGENPDTHMNRMHREDMVKDLDESLKQLRTDYIDIKSLKQSLDLLLVRGNSPSAGTGCCLSLGMMPLCGLEN